MTLTECPICGRETNTVDKRQRNTMYQDEEKNWLVSCAECHAEDCDHFQELWDDINSDIRASVTDALMMININANR